MRHPLDGATLKLQRANVHLDELKKAVGRAREGYPRETITRIDPQAGTCLFAVKRDEPPPVEWSPIIGDALHNIASSLDHLIWELIRKRRYGQEPPTETRATFPIFKNRGRFWKRDKREGEWSGRSGAATLLKVAGDARRLLLEVQPYNDRHGDHPLWHLHTLSNADKHQALHYAHHVVVSGEIEVLSSRDVTIGEFRPSPGRLPLGVHKAIGVMRFEVIGPDPYFNVQPTFGFAEAFVDGGPAEGLPVIDALNDIMDFVVMEVFAARFWPYFGADPDAEIARIRDHAEAYPPEAR